ncbi:MAG: FAD-dependent oxidoreductase [Clostridiaceae bacterium]
MTRIVEDRRCIFDKGKYDVIVAGGGVAGVAAALAAAREGADTLLIEKSVMLGGLGTIGLISWYEPLCNGRGKKIIGGIPEELLKLAIEYGPDDLPEEWRDGQPRQPTGSRYATHFSPSMFAMVLDDILIKNKVNLLFDTLVTCPIMEDNHCYGLIVENKEGREFYQAKVVIDCTGDADVFDRAGAPCMEGKNYLTFISHATTVELADKAVKNNNILNLRKWETVGSNLYGKGHPEGMKLFTGLTGEEVTEYVLTGRQMLFNKLKNNNKFASDIISLPNMAQLRTTRHICGEYELTGNDVFKSPCDSIGTAGDFRKPGDWYEIPFRCLYNAKFDNLLAAGRIVSASGDGWEITRVIPVAALTGQAAGTAAAICAVKSCSTKAVDMVSLQEKLKCKGIMIHYEEEK